MVFLLPLMLLIYLSIISTSCFIRIIIIIDIQDFSCHKTTITELGNSVLGHTVISSIVYSMVQAKGQWFWDMILKRTSRLLCSFFGAAAVIFGAFHVAFFQDSVSFKIMKEWVNLKGVSIFVKYTIYIYIYIYLFVQPTFLHGLLPF